MLRREREAGRLPAGAIRVVAAWINHLRGAGAPVKDANERVVELAGGDLEAAVARILDFLEPALAADQQLVGALAASCTELASG